MANAVDDDLGPLKDHAYFLYVASLGWVAGTSSDDPTPRDLTREEILGEVRSLHFSAEHIYEQLLNKRAVESTQIRMLVSDLGHSIESLASAASHFSDQPPTSENYENQWMHFNKEQKHLVELISMLNSLLDEAGINFVSKHDKTENIPHSEDEIPF